ncbi:aspartate dehydrogenase [Aquincola sp. MAHUQ-54]|uniref:L-aspartate dehydrogenase n=1 Tax=Aquincola agrisoli TaxID=3119538 RepID=A0AAW9QCC2_9BURK
MLSIALVGCGAIGTAVLELLQADAGLSVAAIVVPAAGAVDAQAVASRLAPRAQVAGAVPTEGIDLVVEAAGHAAIEAHVLPALKRGVPCIVASVGALSAEGLPEQLEAAARDGGTQVQLIAGAIGAIDALAAARVGGLALVRYTGRKPPHAWKGTPAEEGRQLDTLAEATVIFEGSAREAARRFPKNANVAATVSLAGLGLDATTVRLIADPAVAENVHTVEAEGAFGSFELTMRNQPLAANPKTSALTVYSAVRALRSRVAPLVI